MATTMQIRKAHMLCYACGFEGDWNDYRAVLSASLPPTFVRFLFGMSTPEKWVWLCEACQMNLKDHSVPGTLLHTLDWTHNREASMTHPSTAATAIVRFRRLSEPGQCCFVWLVKDVRGRIFGGEPSVVMLSRYGDMDLSLATSYGIHVGDAVWRRV